MDEKFERFTRRARRVMSRARDEAERLHHDYIGTEHLLIGLVREKDGIAGRVLRDLGLESERARETVERLTDVGENQSSRVELAPATKHVLQMSYEEARRMGHRYIGTEHILLGMVRHSKNVGMDVLRRLGITPEQIRRQTRRELKEMGMDKPKGHVGRSGRRRSDSTDPYIDELRETLERAVEHERSEMSNELVKAIQMLERVQSSLKEHLEYESLPKDTRNNLEWVISGLRILANTGDREDD